ncbi:hypothetical protein Prudu_005223 [Prunus dulcis]|uniref:R13L1/DRL21-like LRR repeat region domain-containing protein n=1 Tax=Prunus dulcis TaxID=3755 RepID=A0A4Y1QX41_PRUDU|nr:hypothetical protein Prudu_005223 [Prunus dulcis]
MMHYLSNLRNLVNLRHLNNSYVYSLKAMPPQLGSDESGIREIGSLSHLRGTLSLSRLENVIDAEDARKADLKSKERVDELVLEWSDSTQEAQLGMAQWKVSVLSFMERVAAFSSTETLEFQICTTGRNGFLLHKIRNCPQLEGKVPENLDSLETLWNFKCEELVISISNYKQIGALDIDGCKAVVKTSDVEFDLLESLQLSNISEVRLQAGEFTEGLRKVANLTIGGCEELTSSLKNEDRVLQHLISLDVWLLNATLPSLKSWEKKQRSCCNCKY